MTNDADNATGQPIDPSSKENIQRDLSTKFDAEANAASNEQTILETNISGQAEPAPLADTFGRYKILEQLGRGAMGSVYRAEDVQLAREIALKIPHFSQPADPMLLQRFYREAQAAATLRHPGICPVFDVGEIDGQHYISMAYIKGQSLREFIETGTQDVKHAVRLVRKLAQALAEAHKHNVIHRDLKPANIMIDERKEPVVMDFGLAYRSNENEERLTHTGTIMGTPAYMPPEQVDGDTENIGIAADIYSLGIIFYELLTGELPFSGTLMSILKQIATDEPKPPSKLRRGLEPELEAICLKMMAKKIEDRYDSMEKVASALTKYLKKRLIGTEASVAIPPEGRPKSNRREEETERFDSALAPNEQFEAPPDADQYKPLRQAKKSTAKSAQSSKHLVVIGCVLAVAVPVVYFLFLGPSRDNNFASSDVDSTQTAVDVPSDNDDSSGDGHSNGGTGTEADNFALQFTGDSYVTVRGIKRGGSVVTIEAMMRGLPAVDSTVISGLGVSLHLRRGKLHFHAESRDGTSDAASFRLTIKDRLPGLHHVAAVWDGETARLFVNGVEGTREPRSSIDLGEWWKSTDLQIGFNEDREHWVGVMDELRISNTARYDDEFTPPKPADRWTTEEFTVALFHFDEGSGRALKDATGEVSAVITNPKWVPHPSSALPRPFQNRPRIRRP
ncbi:MAG: hypothetical protein CMJ78_26965 [Planctomycetaceae bacterium]|nr:hypothetical protein [Planctomycetaceae bacterium]